MSPTMAATAPVGDSVLLAPPVISFPLEVVTPSTLVTQFKRSTTYYYCVDPLRGNECDYSIPYMTSSSMTHPTSVTVAIAEAQTQTVTVTGSCSEISKPTSIYREPVSTEASKPTSASQEPVSTETSKPTSTSREPVSTMIETDHVTITHDVTVPWSNSTVLATPSIPSVPSVPSTTESAHQPTSPVMISVVINNNDRDRALEKRADAAESPTKVTLESLPVTGSFTPTTPTCPFETAGFPLVTQNHGNYTIFCYGISEGKSFAHIVAPNNWTDCANACDQHGDCSGFVYDGVEWGIGPGKCALKKHMGDLQRPTSREYTGSIAGFRDTALPEPDPSLADYGGPVPPPDLTLGPNRDENDRKIIQTLNGDIPEYPAGDPRGVITRTTRPAGPAPTLAARAPFWPLIAAVMAPWVNYLPTVDASGTPTPTVTVTHTATAAPRPARRDFPWNPFGLLHPPTLTATPTPVTVTATKTVAPHGTGDTAPAPTVAGAEGALEARHLGHGGGKARAGPGTALPKGMTRATLETVTSTRWVVTTPRVTVTVAPDACYRI